MVINNLNDLDAQSGAALLLTGEALTFRGEAVEQMLEALRGRGVRTLDGNDLPEQAKGIEAIPTWAAYSLVGRPLLQAGGRYWYVY